MNCRGFRVYSNGNMSSIGGSNSGEGGVVGYLICTQQGLPLLSKQFYTATSSSSSNSHSTTHSSSHWKSVAQYICLSAGFWTSKSAPFSFVLSTYTYFVTVLTCEDQLLYSCVEVVTSSQASQKYPALVSCSF